MCPRRRVDYHRLLTTPVLRRELPLIGGIIPDKVLPRRESGLECCQRRRGNIRDVRGPSRCMLTCEDVSVFPTMRLSSTGNAKVIW